MSQLKSFADQRLSFLTACVAIPLAFHANIVSGTIVNQYYRNCIGISLGPSYSSISAIERGGKLSPFDGDVFALIESNPMDTKGTSCAIAEALFDTRCATCNANEPHHFMSRRINTPRSKDDSEPRPGFVDIDILPPFFLKLKQTAELWLQDDVEYAAVMVPDYYTREDYATIKDAGKTVGLNIILVEPHSAAAGTAYGVGWSQEDATVLFYDLGRETFQVSAYYADLGIFEYLSNATDHRLAGEIGKAIGTDRYSGLHSLDARAMELVKQTLPVVERVIVEANLSRPDFSHLVVSGVHTRHDLVRSFLEEFMGRKITVPGQDAELWRLWEPSNLDLEEVVAFGAAIFAATLSRPLQVGHVNYPF